MPRDHEKLAKFLEAIEMGMYPAQAARYAGYKEPAKVAKRLVTEDPVVMEHVAAINEASRETLRMTRERVQEGIMKAIDDARLASDPMGQIRGWAEINRMCGFYEPERKEVIHTNLTVAQRRKAIEQASTEELLDMVGGEMVEAEYEVMDDGGNKTGTGR